jgi:microcystin-dependent protein
VIVGLDNMGGSAAGRIVGSGTYTGSISAPTTLGATGGEEAHVQTLAELVAHGHTITDPGHAHTVPLGGATGGGSLGANNYNTTNPLTNTGTATTGITINNQGGGVGHNTIQPSMMLNYILKL